MTVINRVSTYAMHQRTMGDFSKVQSELANLQIQISTGKKTETFQGLVGEVEHFTALETEIEKLKNFQVNIAETTSRFQTQRKAVESMVELTDQMENLITLRRNGANADNIAFALQMEGLRQGVARELNSTFGGRFIFGGTRTNVAPVIVDPNIPDPVTSGVPDDNYYQGSKENVITRPRDNLDIEFDLRADDEAFQKIFAAASLSIEGDDAHDDEKLQAAYTMMRDGLDLLISKQADLDAKILDLNNINERHDALGKYLQGVSEQVINTDIVAASTKVAVDQTILTASFQVFSRLNNLHLINFLE